LHQKTGHWQDLAGTLDKGGIYEQAADRCDFSDFRRTDLRASANGRDRKLKADAQNVVKTISGDKRKAQIYCQIAELSDEIDQEENPAKTEELSQKIDNLEQKLGAEYTTLVGNLKDIDPNSQDAREIGSILEALDRLCED
jgi:hypothetical protein